MAWKKGNPRLFLPLNKRTSLRLIWTLSPSIFSENPPRLGRVSLMSILDCTSTWDIWSGVSCDSIAYFL